MPLSTLLKILTLDSKASHFFSGIVFLPCITKETPFSLERRPHPFPGNHRQIPPKTRDKDLAAVPFPVPYKLARA